MMKKKIATSVLTFLTTPLVFAATYAPMKDEPIYVPSYFLSLSVGPVWADDAGRTQTLLLAPEVLKTYAADKSTDALVDGEVFLGWQKTISPGFIGQFGLAAAATSNARLSGDIWDDADPQFNNYTYSYRIHHSHVAAKGKLLMDRGWYVMPWISGSVGVGFNRAEEFNNVPTIPEAVVNANFASHTKTTFTYTLGAGLQKAITPNIQVGVGYEFADWGKSELSRALGQTNGTGLTLDHLYTNGVLFNITFLA